MKSSKLLQINSILTLLLTVSGCQQPCILLSNTTNILTVSASSHLTLNQHPTSIISKLNRSVAIDVHVNKKLVFWSDVTEKNIKRANLDGSNIITVVKDRAGVIDGLAVEWTTNMLYWTDTSFNKIEVARLDGSRRKVLIVDHLDEPRGISLDPQAGLMFWTDWGASPKIETAYLNGENRHTIISSSLGWPNDIALDYSSQKIYWVDAKLDHIEYADYTGHNRGNLLLHPGIHPFGVDIYSSWLYWTDWGTQSGLHQMDTTSGTLVGKTQVQGRRMGLVVMDSSRQPSKSSGCQTNNGGCAFLCLLKPNGYVCVCPYDMVLGTDGKSCKIPAAGCTQPCLYVSNTTHILSTSASLKHHSMTVLSNLTRAVSVDIHINNRMIFWSDVVEKNIKRANLDGSNIITVVKDRAGVIDGLAVEWSTNLLYWTDTTFNKIEVAQLDGSRRKVLIGDNLDEPRGIALDPLARLMFWTDWGSSPKIESAYLNGENRHTVISSSLGWPNSIALDHTTQMIYWVDAKIGEVVTASYSGANRKQLFFKPGIHPFGVDIYQNWLYWTDWKTVSGLHKMNRTSGELETKLHIYGKRMGLSINDRSRQPSVSNPCQTNNGGCSHLCLLKPNAITCQCSDGMILDSDGKTCRTKVINCSNFIPKPNTVAQSICKTHIGSKCSFSCRNGYSLLSGSTLVTCLSSGNWSTCVDSQPPVFTSCPANILQYAGKDKTRLVTWSTPQATDNSGKIPQLSLSSGPSPPARLSEGVYHVTYTATDEANNNEFCSFTVTIRVVNCNIPTTNGVLQRASCENHFGGSCNFSCPQGYHMVGMSTLHCLATNGGPPGVWDNPLPKCEAIICPALPTPPNAIKSNCHGQGNESVGTVCQFTCLPGYQPLKVQRRTCLSNGTWTGMSLACQPVFCEGLAHPHFGSVTPSTCINGGKYNDICQFSCLKSFKMKGTTSRTCGPDGLWTGMNDTVCQDVTPPTFSDTCPGDKVLILGPCANNMTVNWTRPIASDNSGTVRLHEPFPRPPFVLSEGFYTINYTAEDKAGYSRNCLFKIQITRRTCRDLSPPMNGRISSLSCNNLYGSVAVINCNLGFKISGSSTRTCTSTGQWSGSSTTCTKITCPSPSTLRFGCIEPKTCTTGLPVVYGTWCLFKCNISNGFMNPGPSHASCTANGSWSEDLSTIYCSDVQRPTLSCPSDVTINTDDGKPYATYSWKIPLPQDNSGEKIVAKVNDNIIPPHMFAVGNTIVRYHTQDSSGLGASCEFKVTVYDKEPPTKIFCQKKKEIQSAKRKTNAFFPKAVFIDNVGVDRIITNRNNGSEVTWGEYDIIYTAYDKAGNTRKCTMKLRVTGISKCKRPLPPRHGAIACDNQIVSMFCTIHCNPGYIFAIQPPKVLVCNAANGKWMNNKPIPDIPDCSVKGAAPNIIIHANLHYLIQDCNEKDANEIKSKFLKIIRSFLGGAIMNEYCKLGLCDYGNIYAKCDEREDKRRKRSLDKSTKLTIEFEVKIPYPENSTSDINNTLTEVQSSVMKTINQSAAVIDVNGVKLTLAETPKLNFVTLKCADGEVLNGVSCAGCPPGYFYESSRKACSQCPVNYYQNEEGKTSCLACPSGTSTQKEIGSKKCVKVIKTDSSSSTNIMTTIVTPVVVVLALAIIIAVVAFVLYRRYTNPRRNKSRSDSQKIVFTRPRNESVLETENQMYISALPQNPNLCQGPAKNRVHETVNPAYVSTFQPEEGCPTQQRENCAPTAISSPIYETIKVSQPQPFYVDINDIWTGRHNSGFETETHA